MCTSKNNDSQDDDKRKKKKSGFLAREEKKIRISSKNRIYIVNESKEYDPSLTL